MQIDLDLVSSVKQGEVIVRFYGWQPFCISLGANQSEEVLNKEKLEAEGVDFVYRPTGGRAVFHSEELTYSVSMLIESDSSPKNIYREINRILMDGLTDFHPLLNGLGLEETKTDLKNFYNTANGNLCFAVAAKSEVKFAGKKLIGSAQKLMRNRLLQHGSILTGTHHKKLPGYLIAGDDEISNMNFEIDSKTVDIKTVTGEEVDFNNLVLSLKNSFLKEKVIS